MPLGELWVTTTSTPTQNIPRRRRVGHIILIIKSIQGRVVNPLRDLVISLDLPVLQLRELINWQVKLN
jgi:hypothetical protein